MSESHSGTSLAERAGVNTTGSRNTLSKTVCNLAMTSDWFISSTRNIDLGWDGREPLQRQLEIAVLFVFGNQTETHARVEITHHFVFGGGKIDTCEPIATPLVRQPRQFIEDFLLNLAFEHAATHQPRVYIHGFASLLPDD